MKRFLTLILGVALLGAAPVPAQQPTPSGADHAAALLQKAQEAAAQGHAQQAAEYARAAAELYVAQQRNAEATRLAQSRTRAAREAAEPFVEGVEITLRARDAQLQVERAHIAEQSASLWAAERDQIARDEMTAAGMRSERVRRQEPHAADPRSPRAFMAPAAPEGEWRAAPAPGAPQHEEIGMTLRLIHAEVQALRAEVQALRAEMALVRMHGGNAHGAGASSQAPARAGALSGRMGVGVWSPQSKDAKHQIIIIGPDGQQMEVTGHDGEVGGVWTSEPGDAPSSLWHHGHELADVERSLQSLGELGYLDSGASTELPSPKRLYFAAPLPDSVPKPLLVPAAPATPATPAVPRTPLR